MPGTDVVDVESWAEEARKQKLADKLKRLMDMRRMDPDSLAQACSRSSRGDK